MTEAVPVKVEVGLKEESVHGIPDKTSHAAASYADAAADFDALAKTRKDLDISGHGIDGLGYGTGYGIQGGYGRGYGGYGGYGSGYGSGYGR